MVEIKNITSDGCNRMDTIEWIRILDWGNLPEQRRKGQRKKHINEKLKDKEDRCRGTHIWIIGILEK